MASVDPTDTAAVATTSPTTESQVATIESEARKFPGWPGDTVYRLIVPVMKVGSIIGRKGDAIKKLCEETRARVRVLDGPVASPDRIVLISGKEEPEAAVSPAMDAVLRIAKRVNGLPESDEDVKLSGPASIAFCSIKLLVPSPHATNLIGKQGSTIKSIQESSGASIRVLSNDEVPTYVNLDEKVVEVQGEAVKVIKALESVVGHLRKFLVDHSVLPLFEKNNNSTMVPQMVSQDRQVENWAEKTMMRPTMDAGIGSNDYSLLLKREAQYIDRERNLDSKLSLSGLSYYGQDAGLSGMSSSGRGLAGGPIITQVAQTMQIPLTYCDDIIGVGGSKIAYIRRSSGAILTVQESMGLADEITVEIKGNSAQVQAAQQLIQECVNNHKEVIPRSYGMTELDSRSLYSQMKNSYPSSSFGSQQYEAQYPYGSSGLGGYGSYRM